jgi:hypothetical protein
MGLDFRARERFAMKKTLITAAAIAFAFAPICRSQQPASAPAQPQAQNWSTYSYPEDGFSVVLPAMPDFAKQNQGTKVDNIELHTYIASAGRVAFYVGVCDYGSAAKGSEPDKLLQAGMTGALTTTNAHLLSQKPITLNANQGLAFEAESDQFHLFARIYMVSTVFYQTMVAWPLGSPYADTPRFLDSFALIPRTATLTQPQVNWQAYSYPEDGFSVSLPATPDIGKQNTDTSIGTLAIHTYSAQDGSVEFLVAVTDFGQQSASVDPDKLLQSGMNGAMSNINAHVVSQKAIALGANHGLAFEAESDKLHLSGRFYMVGNSLYQTMVALPVGSNYPNTARFLDSFALIQRAVN